MQTPSMEDRVSSAVAAVVKSPADIALEREDDPSSAEFEELLSEEAGVKEAVGTSLMTETAA